MIKSIIIITTLLGGQVHETTPEIARAIDATCAGDTTCQLDAIAVCYIESRCRMVGCNSSDACGPWQQKPRYAYEVEGDRRLALTTDAKAAARQFVAKRARYMRLHGDKWIRRYAGGTEASNDVAEARYHRVLARIKRIAREL